MSKSVMPSSEKQLIGRLKTELAELEILVKQNASLDATHEQKILSVERHLEELKDSTKAALEWSHGTVLVMHLREEDINSPLLQIVFQKFVTSFHLIPKSEERKQIEKIWKYFIKNNCLSPFLLPEPERDSKLFLTFIRKCFDLIKKGVINAGVVLDYVVTGTVTCLLDLVENPSSSSLNNILDLMFMELVEPSCSSSKSAVKIVLRTCGWKVTDAIRNMLNPIILQTTDGPYYSYRDVYKVILELISIEKYLVLGLINNTELCFMPGREDREAGLEFFCELFGSKSTAGPDYYTSLWNKFLVSCRDTIMCNTELLILGKHTSSILGQPAALPDWCSLLTFFFEHVLDSKVEISFITGMTDALSQYYSEDIEPLMELFKKLLTPETVLERFGEAREILIKNLAKVYKRIAGAGVGNLSLLKNHKISSQLISCFLGTCSSFSPPNERWILLRKIFVKHLVPFDLPAEKRMKMLLYLWINCNGEWIVFHELFFKINRVRSRVNNILYIMKDEETFALHKMHLSKQKCELDFYLMREKENSIMYATEVLGKALGASPKLRFVLTNLVSESITCENAHRLSKAAKHYLEPFTNDENCKIVDGLFFYLMELTVDASALRHLVKLVDSCVEGHEFASLMNLNRLHVARTALHLLNEILVMLPHLGYNSDILSYMVKWAQSKNCSLSMLSVRCLSSIAYVKTLDSWNHNYVVEELVPLWVSMIENGSRSEVKAAIQCLGEHASLQPFRNALLKEVLNIISNQLASESKVSDSFERGVSALGHFSSIRLSEPLKKEVEKLCMLHLLHLITDSSNQEVRSSSTSSDTSCNNSWVDWQDLSIDVRIKLQAIRSLGRCMRFCGSSSTVKDILGTLQRIVCSPMESIGGDFRAVDIDRLRYEAACAALSIFEADVNHPFVSKELLIALSHIITDPREEVRLEFAKKLCQGLSPHKIQSLKRGHKRGNLPASMLGILALLGSDRWRNKTETLEIAQISLQEVFVSKQMDRMRKMSMEKVTYQQLYEKNPHLVFENILAIAVPILAEHKDFQIPEDETDFEVNTDPLVKMTHCLHFVCAMLCHPSTYGGQVEKVYMMNIVKFSRDLIYLPSIEPLKMKYRLMFELLEIVVKYYKPSKDFSCLLTPTLVLPPPFFRENREVTSPLPNILPIPLIRTVEKCIHEKSTCLSESNINNNELEDNDANITPSFEQSWEEAESQQNASFESHSDTYSQDFSALGNAAHSTPASLARKRTKRH